MTPAKRKHEEAVGETARERKKQKKDVARTIAVQSVASITVPENAVAGPSTMATDSELVVAFQVTRVGRALCQGMKRLPSSIDVEKFAEVSNLLC
jgi:hypothetical protein